MRKNNMPKVIRIMNARVVSSNQKKKRKKKIAIIIILTMVF